jgi:GT2 family glycosyltransferase
VLELQQDARWRTDGKFFRVGGQRVWLKSVTYGPFPDGRPDEFRADFSQIAAAGFNSVRIYTMPDLRLLDAAHAQGLVVFGGLPWWQGADFFRQPGYYSAAQVALVEGLQPIREHPALAGIYIGNEVPADLVKWMGPLKVRHALEDLIRLGKQIAPQLLFAYANYPSTEYLEPENADFTAFNVYLEQESAFRSYLKRLHHIAGDRPLVISEFGLDSRRNGLDRQMETLAWAMQAARDLETAGMTIYAWSDRWKNGEIEVLDWDLGLMDRLNRPKPALEALRNLPRPVCAEKSPTFSVIVCTRNGRSRIAACLSAIERTKPFETLVVDDGSTDDTADFVATHFPRVRLIRLLPSGLSAARNTGAAAARGEIFAFTDDDCEPDDEWISRLARIFQNGNYAAAGGPNLPPPPRNWEEAVVAAAPGAPSHVMLDDEEAEHLPGCNLAVTRRAFQEIGGFDPQFHTAGDDVDFCWRLRDAGFRLGFAPGAFVWHWRRPSIRAFLAQQLGYGCAERLLMAKFPSRFSKHGGAKWQGFVYGGGPIRVMEDSIIYHGQMGDAAYQGICNRMLPLRGLEPPFDTFLARFSLSLVKFLQVRLRAWARNHRMPLPPWRSLAARVEACEEEVEVPLGHDRESLLRLLIAQGWKPASANAAWDLEKSGTRLLMALEKSPSLPKRMLVRTWGPERVDWTDLRI